MLSSARARLDSQRLVGAAGAGGLREPVEGLGRAGRLSAPGFVDRYNQTARPFSWKFTASDLHGLMDRISRHEQQDDPQDEPLPEAV
jgi:hypothetical protein